LAVRDAPNKSVNVKRAEEDKGQLLQLMKQASTRKPLGENKEQQRPLAIKDAPNRSVNAKRADEDKGQLLLLMKQASTRRQGGTKQLGEDKEHRLPAITEGPSGSNTKKKRSKRSSTKKKRSAPDPDDPIAPSGPDPEEWTLYGNTHAPSKLDPEERSRYVKGNRMSKSVDPEEWTLHHNQATKSDPEEWTLYGKSKVTKLEPDEWTLTGQNTDLVLYEP